MGQIISSKQLTNKDFVHKILLNHQEIKNLKNHMKNIYAFTPQNCNKQAQINSRGNGGVTKYFKVPLSLRSRKKHSGTISYQKIETKNKIFYIYVLKKQESSI